MQYYYLLFYSKKFLYVWNEGEEEDCVPRLTWGTDSGGRKESVPLVEVVLCTAVHHQSGKVTSDTQKTESKGVQLVFRASFLPFPYSTTYYALSIWGKA